jgi:hypothetical protein
VFEQWQSFEALYQRTPSREDEVAYPAALAQLDETRRKAMGDEMATGAAYAADGA